MMPHIAEDLGFDSVWLTDHVVGLRSFAPVYETAWSEILVSLTHIAATTSTIRLGTGVLVVPYRDPVLTAKMVATIDQLSAGRVILGIGSGWSREEFSALGRFNLFDARGAVTDEALDVMVECWRGRESSWRGVNFAFEKVTVTPSPTQYPHPPIWVGGQSGPALRRAARIGDAWHPTNISPSEVARLGILLDERAERAVPRTIRIGIPAEELDRVSDLLEEYEAAGCVEAAVQVRSDSCEYEDQLVHLKTIARQLNL